MLVENNGLIVLDEEDIRGIDALIATLDIHVKGGRSFTIQEATHFVREWECVRRGGYTNSFDGDIESDDE